MFMILVIVIRTLFVHFEIPIDFVDSILMMVLATAFDLTIMKKLMKE